jgi:hypothetical protein
VQSTPPASRRSTRTWTPHDGQRNELQDPPHGNFRAFTPTVCSTSPNLMTTSVISGVMTPVARNREILMLGKSS